MHFSILTLTLLTPQLLTEALENLLVRDKQVEAAAATEREFYRVGEPGGTIFYVRTGMVKLMQDHGPDGETLCVVCPGEVFGEEILFGEPQYQANAHRIAKGEIFKIPVPFFLRMANRFPELWRGLAALIQHRVEFEQRRFRGLANGSTDERIIAMLQHLAPNCPPTLVDGSDRSVHGIPLTQAELAVMVGASRETTSSALNAMERRGALELKRGRILMPPVKTTAAQAG